MTSKPVIFAAHQPTPPPTAPLVSAVLTPPAATQPVTADDDEPTGPDLDDMDEDEEDAEDDHVDDAFAGDYHNDYQDDYYDAGSDYDYD